jgi:hypothetical protein
MSKQKRKCIVSSVLVCVKTLLKMTSLLDTAVYVVELDRRFKGVNCLHYQSPEVIRRHIPEGSYFYTRRNENLKPHFCN